MTSTMRFDRWENPDTLSGINIDEAAVKSQVGLVNVVPTSVGNGTANAQGLVTFTSVANVQLNGVFTSTYKKYRILFNTTAISSSVGIQARFTSGGTVDSSATYFSDFIFHYGGASVAAFANGGVTQADILVAYSSGRAAGQLSSVIDLTNPAQSNVTIATFNSGNGNNQGANTGEVRLGYFGVDKTDSFDGIRFFTAGGQTMSGTVQVFGYNE